MSIKMESPAAIAEELGERLKQARLNANLTQSEVADRAGLSRKVVLNAEKGNVRLEALVAILDALELAGQLEQFLPKQEISPIQLSRLQGKARQRASGRRTAKDDESPEW